MKWKFPSMGHKSRDLVFKKRRRTRNLPFTRENVHEVYKEKCMEKYYIIKWSNIFILYAHLHSNVQMEGKKSHLVILAYLKKKLHQAQFTTLRFFIVLNKSFPLSFAWRDHTRAWQNCKCSKLTYDKWLNAHFNTIQVAA